jgi:hypothetical protein
VADRTARETNETISSTISVKMNKAPMTAPDSIIFARNSLPAPPWPSGSHTAGLVNSGARAIAGTPRTPHTTTVQATGRQRRETSRPVGYSKKRNITAANAGTMSQVVIHATGRCRRS